MHCSIPEWTRSFRQPNYRRYFFGQAISMAGTFMQFGAIPWVTWELTHSPWWLGAGNFFYQIPFLLFGLLGGVIADRFSLRRLIAFTQTSSLLQAMTLTVLALTHHLTLPALLMLVSLQGVINAVDLPARQAFVQDLVGPTDLSNAIALNASLVHTMRVVGPVIAGLILLHFGAGICFFVNAVSYIAVLVALVRINAVTLYPHPANNQELGPALCDGFKIIRTTPALRIPLTLIAIVSLAGAPYLAFLPYFAEQVYGGGPDLLGYLMGTTAAGAVTGAICLAQVRQPQLERWLSRAAFLLSVALIAFAASPRLMTALPPLFALGLGFVICISGTNTLLQQRAPVAARGRVVSYITTAFFGLTPIGSLIVGAIAIHLGVRWVLTLGGIICLLTTTWYTFAQARRNKVPG